MITQIKKGDRFICIKDVVMSIGETAYKAGKVYECKSKEKLGFNLPSEIFGTHTWDLNDGLFNEHFIPYTNEALHAYLFRIKYENPEAKIFRELLKDLDREMGRSTAGDGNYKSRMERCPFRHDPDLQHEMTTDDIRAREAELEAAAERQMDQTYERSTKASKSIKNLSDITGIEFAGSDGIVTPSYYDNSKGSLYKVATERGWNPYLFDLVKRLERGGKKDPLIQEIDKSIAVLQLWRKEASCE